MIKYCVLELVPFIISYFFFIMMWSIFFVVLGMEIDPEVNEADRLSYYQKMLLQTFRTVIGELAMPQYGKILEAYEENNSSFYVI